MSDSESTEYTITGNLDKHLSDVRERDGGGVVATFKIETPSSKIEASSSTIDIASLHESDQYVVGVMKAAFPGEQLQFSGAGHIGNEDVLRYVITEGPAAEHVRQVMARREQAGEAEIS